jgi:hypothetical protein
MPSLQHEAPLEVIRQQPAVVADLLRRLLPHLPLPDRVTGALGSADLTQVAPAAGRSSPPATPASTCARSSSTPARSPAPQAPAPT